MRSLPGMRELYRHVRRLQIAPEKSLADGSWRRRPRFARRRVPRPAGFGLSVAEGDRAGDGPRPRAYAVAVIAALDDPLAVLVADNLSHMMGPHHDGANRRTTSV
jgi:hypothetical protein